MSKGPGFKEVNLFVSLLGAVLLLIMLMALSGCGHNPEDDLWIVLKHADQQR